MAIGFFTSLGIGLFSFVVPLMSLDEKISGAWLGSAFAGYYFAKLLAAPLSGAAADKFGPKPVLICATLAGCLIPLFALLKNDLEVLYFVQFSLGLISGLIKPVGMAILGSNIARKSLPRSFAFHAFSYHIALFIGPLIGGIFYIKGSVQPILIGLSICMGLSCLVSIFLLPKQTTTTVSPSKQHTSFSFGLQTLALLIAIGGRTIGIGFLAAFYPILLSIILGRGIKIALLFAIPGLATCLGLLAINRFAEHKPDLHMTICGMLLSSLAMFFLGEAETSWQFITLGSTMGIGAALSVPASMSMASDISLQQGKIFGTAHLAAGLGFLIGPLLGGFLIPELHSINPVLQIAATLGALSCVPLLCSALQSHFHFGRGIAWGVALTLALFLIIPAAVRSKVLLQKDSHINDGIYQFTDVAMGTIVNLTLVADSQKKADDAARKTLTTMRALQQDFDFRSPHGSIGRINRDAGHGWVKPSQRSFGLIMRTLVISRQSQGIFDPSVGALTTSPIYYALDTHLAEKKKGLVDYRLIEIDTSGKRIRLARMGMALDMGGIAKGTIIDTAVTVLKKQGIKSGIVEAGGDFYCFGDREWHIGIRHPRDKKLFGTLAIREQGVCGSGDYQQYVTFEDKKGSERRHHIINPSTMLSAHQSIGVTVISDTAERADALATTLFIMGPINGQEFLDKYYPTTAAVWFSPDQSVILSKNFPAR